MAVVPIVRYMILCEEWRMSLHNPNGVDILGLLSNIHPFGGPLYPVYWGDLCVFLCVTSGFGQGEGHIRCVFEDTEQTIFRTPNRPITFPKDPLKVIAMPFRIRHCVFPYPGLYSIQFWYEGQKIEERPLRVR